MQTEQRKPGRKRDLPVKEINRMLDEGMRQIDVALLFDVSQTTISRLAAMPEKGARLCTCCHQRAIANGNWFLCSECYRHQIQEENIVRA